MVIYIYVECLQIKMIELQRACETYIHRIYICGRIEVTSEIGSGLIRAKGPFDFSPLTESPVNVVLGLICCLNFHHSVPRTVIRYQKWIQ